MDLIGWINRGGPGLVGEPNRDKPLTIRLDRQELRHLIERGSQWWQLGTLLPGGKEVVASVRSVCRQRLNYVDQRFQILKASEACTGQMTTIYGKRALEHEAPTCTLNYTRVTSPRTVYKQKEVLGRVVAPTATLSLGRTTKRTDVPNLGVKAQLSVSNATVFDTLHLRQPHKPSIAETYETERSGRWK